MPDLICRNKKMYQPHIFFIYYPHKIIHISCCPRIIFLQNHTCLNEDTTSAMTTYYTSSPTSSSYPSLLRTVCDTYITLSGLDRKMNLAWSLMSAWWCWLLIPYRATQRYRGINKKRFTTQGPLRTDWIWRDINSLWVTVSFAWFSATGWSCKCLDWLLCCGL